MSFVDFEGKYPRYPEVDDIVLSTAEREEWVDLHSYMNATPFTIAGELAPLIARMVVRAHSAILRARARTRVAARAPAVRGYRLFRVLGLRHLPVVRPPPCGVILVWWIICPLPLAGG